LITTDDDDIADRLRLLRNQGMRARYQYEMAGNNFRLTDLQAAVCIPQLATYAESVAARQRNARHLTDALGDIGWLTTPAQLPSRHHVWHQYTILLTEDAPLTRDELAAHLESEGVGSGAYYPRVVYDYDCYRHDDRVRPDPVPIAESVARRCLSLPVHPGLDESQLAIVAAAVRSAVR
jgi:dTDP-4-amino-4,6-dideoxygalactose transaminase